MKRCNFEGCKTMVPDKAGKCYPHRKTNDAYRRRLRERAARNEKSQVRKAREEAARIALQSQLEAVLRSSL